VSTTTTETWNNTVIDADLTRSTPSDAVALANVDVTSPSRLDSTQITDPTSSHQTASSTNTRLEHTEASTLVDRDASSYTAAATASTYVTDETSVISAHLSSNESSTRSTKTVSSSTEPMSLRSESGENTKTTLASTDKSLSTEVLITKHNETSDPDVAVLASSSSPLSSLLIGETTIDTNTLDSITKPTGVKAPVSGETTTSMSTPIDVLTTDTASSFGDPANAISTVNLTQQSSANLVATSSDPRELLYSDGTTKLFLSDFSANKTATPVTDATSNNETNVHLPVTTAFLNDSGSATTSKYTFYHKPTSDNSLLLPLLAGETKAVEITKTSLSGGSSPDDQTSAHFVKSLSTQSVVRLGEKSSHPTRFSTTHSESAEVSSAFHSSTFPSDDSTSSSSLSLSSSSQNSQQTATAAEYMTRSTAAGTSSLISKNRTTDVASDDEVKNETMSTASQLQDRTSSDLSSLSNDSSTYLPNAGSTMIRTTSAFRPSTTVHYSMEPTEHHNITQPSRGYSHSVYTQSGVSSENSSTSEVLKSLDSTYTTQTGRNTTSRLVTATQKRIFYSRSSTDAAVTVSPDDSAAEVTTSTAPGTPSLLSKDRTTDVVSDSDVKNEATSSVSDLSSASNERSTSSLNVDSTMIQTTVASRPATTAHYSVKSTERQNVTQRSSGHSDLERTSLKTIDSSIYTQSGVSSENSTTSEVLKSWYPTYTLQTEHDTTSRLVTASTKKPISYSRPSTDVAVTVSPDDSAAEVTTSATLGTSVRLSTNRTIDIPVVVVSGDLVKNDATSTVSQLQDRTSSDLSSVSSERSTSLSNAGSTMIHTTVASVPATTVHYSVESTERQNVTQPSSSYSHLETTTLTVVDHSVYTQSGVSTENSATSEVLKSLDSTYTTQAEHDTTTRLVTATKKPISYSRPSTDAAVTASPDDSAAEVTTSTAPGTPSLLSKDRTTDVVSDSDVKNEATSSVSDLSSASNERSTSSLNVDSTMIQTTVASRPATTAHYSVKSTERQNVTQPSSAYSDFGRTTLTTADNSLQTRSGGASFAQTAMMSSPSSSSLDRSYDTSVTYYPTTEKATSVAQFTSRFTEDVSRHLEGTSRDSSPADFTESASILRNSNTTSLSTDTVTKSTEKIKRTRTNTVEIASSAVTSLTTEPTSRFSASATSSVSTNSAADETTTENGLQLSSLSTTKSANDSSSTTPVTTSSASVASSVADGLTNLETTNERSSAVTTSSSKKFSRNPLVTVDVADETPENNSSVYTYSELTVSYSRSAGTSTADTLSQGMSH